MPTTTRTTFSDIKPDIIRTHILPRLDGASLSATAASSSYLKNLCSDGSLWSQICKTTWPSITHPRVDHVLSTFPAGHRSFFDDTFPALISDVNRRNARLHWSTHKSDSSSCNLDRSFCTWTPELISAVDIRYRNEIIYSGVKFTGISPAFLSSPFSIEHTGNNSGDSTGISKTIGLTVDEISGADLATLEHLKESVTLNWVLIDPTRKRACNLSSIKPVTARQDWVTNETILRYVTILPDGNTVVKCRIQVVLGVGEKGVGLYVKEVDMKLKDMDSGCLDGVGFLKVVEGALMAENGARRKVMGDEERGRSYREFKEIKKEKKKWEEKKERKKELAVYFNYVAIFVSFFFSLHFAYLLFR